MTSALGAKRGSFSFFRVAAATVPLP
jgi:hypothetical protein